jgi:hypothetical protein
VRAGATPNIGAGQIVLNSAPALTATAPTITSSAGNWSCGQCSFTGYYREWLRSGVVVSGPTWVAGSPNGVSFSTALTNPDTDLGHPFTSAVKPCNADGCYGSYVKGNNVTPAYPSGWTSNVGYSISAPNEITDAQAQSMALEDSRKLNSDGSDDGADSSQPYDISDSEGDISAGGHPHHCWEAIMTAHAGGLGSQRVLHQDTVWCARNDTHNISYRRTRTGTSTGTLCGADSKEQWRVSGGVGQYHVTVHSRATYTCDSIWFIPGIHTHCNVEARYSWYDNAVWSNETSDPHSCSGTL